MSNGLKDTWPLSPSSTIPATSRLPSKGQPVEDQPTPFITQEHAITAAANRLIFVGQRLSSIDFETFLPLILK